MEIVFTNPEYLWLLLVVPVIAFVHFSGIKYTKKKAVNFANFEAISRVMGGKLLSKNFFMLGIRIIMVILLVLSVAGATLWYEGQTHNYDVVLAMDASGSMLVDDFYPDRLNASKVAAKTYIDSLLPGDRVGIISFSGISFIEQDLTDDFEKAKSVIEKIDIRPVGGTAIGDAIVSSTNLLTKSKKTKVIILITDGSGNMGVSINTSVDYAKQNNVIINTIGVGTEEGGHYLKRMQTILYWIQEASGILPRLQEANSLYQKMKKN